MKSFINVLADYHDAPWEKEVTISCPQEHIDKKMKAVTRKRKNTISPDTVEKGDVCVLSLKSELEKFNKPTVFITVGGGLFDTGFEEQLLGHSAGDHFDTTVNQTNVSVEVKSVTRTVFPDATDEMVKEYASDKEELKDISTVDAYKKYIIEEYIKEVKNTVFYEKVSDIFEYAITHTDIEFNDEEVAEIVEEDKKAMNEELSESGQSKTYKELTERELQSFGVNTVEEMEQFFLETAEYRIAETLYLAAVRGMDTKEISVFDFEYYDLEFIEEYVKENLVMKEVK